MSNVKIKKIRTICTSPNGVDNLVVIKIETNEPGLYGLGCGTYTQRHLAVVHMVEEYLAPLLIGRGIDNITDLWHVMNCNPYWRNGPVLNNAISGIDQALWDLKGKLAEMPVYELLGGKCREAADVYCHVDGCTLAEVEENIHAATEKGFRYLRIQMGNYGGNMNGMSKNDHRDSKASSMQHIISPDKAPTGAYYDPYVYMDSTIKLFDHIRLKFGQRIQLCHDVHERLTPAEALRLAKELEPYRLFFLEDMLPPEQVRWLDVFREQTSTPLAIGELFNNPDEYGDLITNRRIDFIRCHLSQIGGLTPAIKLARTCESFGIRTAWHGPADLSPVGMAAQLHLELASPNFGIHEGGICSERLREIFPGCPEIKNGYMYANDKPGLGVDLDETAAQEYPCVTDTVLWTQARRPDGTLFTP